MRERVSQREPKLVVTSKAKVKIRAVSMNIIMMFMPGATDKERESQNVQNRNGSVCR